MIYSWGDLISLEYGKPVKDKAKTDGKYPVYGTNGQIGTSDLPPLCDHPSFILGRKGAYRGVHFSGVPFSVIDTAFYTENLHPELLDIKWAYYKFLTYDINSMDSGSAIPSTDRYEIYAIEVDLPSIQEQKRAVRLLECFDKKIVLNGKTNDNLQQQMHLLYQNLLDNCECLLTRLEEVSQKIAMGPFGSNIKVSTFVPEGVPIISGNHLRSIFLEEPSFNFITEEHAQRLKNSMVYPRDIVFTHAGNIGQVAMIPEGCDYPYYMISQRQFYMRCDESKIVPEIVLFFFHSREGRGKLLANANSTGVPSIAQPSTHLKNIEMPMPSKKDQDEWHKVIKPLVEEYVVLCQENKRLVALRDSLLPKLMSGEIDVSDIQI